MTPIVKRRNIFSLLELVPENLGTVYKNLECPGSLCEKQSNEKFSPKIQTTAMTRRLLWTTLKQFGEALSLAPLATLLYLTMEPTMTSMRLRG